MIFTDHHLELLECGEKTQTRRQKPIEDIRYTVGTVYRATEGGSDMFTPIEECDLFVRVTEMYEQSLGEITESDCTAEGNYTKDQFRRKWEQINGEWDPSETVTVLCIEPVLEHPTESE
jgi:hypothetical protein